MSDRTWTRRLSGFVFAMFAAASAAAQFTPPPCTGAVFNDVNCSGLFDAWIEQYAADQITGGCGGGNYSPGQPGHPWADGCLRRKGRAEHVDLEPWRTRLPRHGHRRRGDGAERQRLQ